MIHRNCFRIMFVPNSFFVAVFVAVFVAFIVFLFARPKLPDMVGNEAKRMKYLNVKRIQYTCEILTMSDLCANDLTFQPPNGEQ